MRNAGRVGRRAGAAALAAAVVVGCWGGAARGEDFDWRAVGGGSFITTVKNQGGASTCWAFSSSSTLESRIKLTRNDPTWNPDVAEQVLVSAGTMGDVASGGWEYKCLDYFTSNGTVVEGMLGYTQQNTAPGWPLGFGWQQTVARTTANTNWVGSTTAQIKAELRQYGPLLIGINAGLMAGSPPTSTIPFAAGVNHAVELIGYHDSGDVATSYWIIKNQWGTGWGDGGIGYMSFGDVEGFARVHAITGPGYFVGALGAATWQGGAGAWGGGTAGWVKNGAVGAGNWANGEDAAVFNAAGGAVAVADYTSAHTVMINAGATGYSFGGGSLIVTAGGIRAAEDAAFDLPVTVGAPQQWWVAAGKTVTFTGMIDTHINTLAITGDGDVVAQGVIRDVTTNPAYAGLLAGVGGSLARLGKGTLRLSGENGAITIPGGVLVGGGGRLVWDNSVFNTGGRLAAAAPVTLGNGEFALVGNAAGTTVQTGAVVLSTGANVVTVGADTAGASVTAAGLTRAVNGKSGWATLLVRGGNLGTVTGGADGAVFFTAGPALTGSGTGAMKGILPYVIADAAAGGRGTDFATYDAATGIRPLSAAEYSADVVAAGTNVRLTAGNTVTAKTSINSLTVANAGTGVVLTMSNTLTVAGSGILSTGTVGNSITGGTLTATANSAVSGGELIVHAVADLAIASVIANSGTGGGALAVTLTKAGAGSVTLTAANTMTGAVHVNEGVLVVKGTMATVSNLFANGGTAAIDGGNMTTSSFSSIGQAAGDNGALLMTGTGRLTVKGDLNIADATNSVGAVTVQGSAVLNMKTLYVGKSGTASGTLNLTSGSIGVVSGGSDWRVGGGTGPNDVAAQGVVTVSGGTMNAGNVGLNIGAYGRGTLNQSGGVVSSAGVMAVGAFAGGVGVMELLGGTLTQSGAASRLTVGDQGTGTLNVSGTAVVDLVGGLRMASVANGTTGSGIVNLNGGTIQAALVEGMGGDSTFNFNGGVLKARASSATFMQGVTRAVVLGGGAVIDSGTNSIATAQPLLAGAGSVGGLTKLGAGMLTLSGASTFVGDVTVNGGTLVAAHGAALGGGAGVVMLTGGAVGSTLGVQGGILLAKPLGALAGRTGGAANVAHVANLSGNNTIGGNMVGSAGAGDQFNFQSDQGVLTVAGGFTLGAGSGALKLSGASNGVWQGDVANGAGTLSVVKNGGGAWTLAGNNSIGGATVINAGQLTFGGGGISTSTAAAISGAGALVVSPGAALTSDAVVLPSLTVGGTQVIRQNGTAAGTSVIGGNFALGSAGRLDITDNAFVVEATAVTKDGLLGQLAAAVSSGSHGGVWDGATGITSATAGADPLHIIVAVVDNSLLGLTSFGGVAVDAMSILLEATYVGDTNLDRKVNVADLGIFATHYGQAGGLLDGDFNGDGMVNVADLGMFASNYGDGMASPTFGVLAQSAPMVAAFATAAAVPEPAGLGVMAAGAGVLLLRRRRVR